MRRKSRGGCATKAYEVRRWESQPHEHILGRALPSLALETRHIDFSSAHLGNVEPRVVWRHLKATDR